MNRFCLRDGWRERRVCVETCQCKGVQVGVIRFV